MFEALAIEKLEQLKRSVAGEDVKGFSFFPRFGICWHLFANTKENEITHTYLKSAFIALGLDEDYPVETQIYGDGEEAGRAYLYCSNVYDPSTEYGKLRLKLIDDLIQYYTKLLTL